jgi:hypothetical protein
MAVVEFCDAAALAMSNWLRVRLFGDAFIASATGDDDDVEVDCPAPPDGPLAVSLELPDRKAQKTMRICNYV